MTPQQTGQQIRDVIHLLMMESLIDHQNYPSSRTSGTQTIIGISGSPDLSISMREIDYSEIYQLLVAAGAYHIKMIDGGIIQLLYTFENNAIHSHRLCYFPSPSLEAYDEMAQLYEDDEVFADIFSRFTIRSPMRFDYSANEDEFVEFDHPKSHMTIGHYKDCRIPVTGPLTPFRFMRFLLRSFYYCAYGRVNLDHRATQTAFQNSITQGEQTLLHISG